MPKKLSKKAKSQRSRERALLEKVHLNAAGIDVGAATHWVAVPEDRDENSVRSFGVFTSDLIALCEWLKRCQIETIAMESTGVYWIPLFQVLERNGFEVRLVNASHAKNVPGRKTDVKDCQWLQELHTFGMLGGSFRPEGKMCVVRSYLRLRDTLSKDCNSLVQRMQKALTEMNIQIHRVISDITGVTAFRACFTPTTWRGSASFGTNQPFATSSSSLRLMWRSIVVRAVRGCVSGSAASRMRQT